jgi:hypothetical protein
MGLGREIEFVVADGKKSLEREGIDCSVEVMSYFTVCIPYFNCTNGQNWCRRGELPFFGAWSVAENSLWWPSSEEA